MCVCVCKQHDKIFLVTLPSTLFQNAEGQLADPLARLSDSPKTELRLHMIHDPSLPNNTEHDQLCTDLLPSKNPPEYEHFKTFIFLGDMFYSCGHFRSIKGQGMSQTSDFRKQTTLQVHFTHTHRLTILPWWLFGKPAEATVSLPLHQEVLQLLTFMTAGQLSNLVSFVCAKATKRHCITLD